MYGSCNILLINRNWNLSTKKKKFYYCNKIKNALQFFFHYPLETVFAFSKENASTFRRNVEGFRKVLII